MLKNKWAILKEIACILQIPYKATIALQAKKLVLSDVYGIWMKMTLHLKSSKTKYRFQTTLAEKLLLSLDDRKALIFENDLMDCAIFLDPRYRKTIINDTTRVAKIKQTLNNIWQRFSESSEENNDQSETLNNLSNNSSFDELDELEKFLSNSIEANPPEATRQSDILFIIDSFKPDDLKPNASAIEYWESVKKIHPELYQISLIIYSVPPTEVQMERDFSKLNYIFNNRRCSLAHERLEDIMIVNLNPDLFYDIKSEELSN